MTSFLVKRYLFFTWILKGLRVELYFSQYVGLLNGEKT